MSKHSPKPKSRNAIQRRKKAQLAAKPMKLKKVRRQIKDFLYLNADESIETKTDLNEISGQQGKFIL